MNPFPLPARSSILLAGDFNALNPLDSAFYTARGRLLCSKAARLAVR